eukprot:2461914-Pleurochrysis_carterae.AAC.1
MSAAAQGRTQGQEWPRRSGSSCHPVGKPTSVAIAKCRRESVATPPHCRKCVACVRYRDSR